MADAQFVFTEAVRKAGSRAASLAILPAVVAVKGKTEHDYVDAASELLTLWRRRVVELDKAGWKTTEGVMFQYLRNCHPSMYMLETASGMWCCKQESICPWCYARDVDSLFCTVKET